MPKKKIIGRAKPKRKAQFEASRPGANVKYNPIVYSNLNVRHPRGDWKKVQPILPTAFGWNEHDAITKTCDCPKLWVPKGYEETFNKFSELQKIFYKNLKSKSKRKEYLKHFVPKQKETAHELGSYHSVAESQSISKYNL